MVDAIKPKFFEKLADYGKGVKKSPVGKGIGSAADGFSDIVKNGAHKMAGKVPEGVPTAVLCIVASTAILGTLEKIGKAAAAGGEKMVINKGSRKLLRNIANGGRRVGEWGYDLSFSLKGTLNRALGRTPAKRAEKAARKAAAAQVKADRKAKTLATV